jgi:hypothetical protein
MRASAREGKIDHDRIAHHGRLSCFNGASDLAEIGNRPRPKAPWSKGPSTPTDAIDRTTTIGHRTRAHDRTSHRRGTTHDATLRYTGGLAVDHRICGSRVNSHRRDERGDGESREYEQAHGRLHLWLIGVNLTLVGLVVDRAWMRVQLALR